MKEYWRFIRFALFSVSAGLIEIGVFALLNELKQDKNHNLVPYCFIDTDKLKEVAKIPGSYIIEREISNIWNQVVFNDANLRSTISDSIIKQDKEISRKMQEFGYMDEQGKVIKTYIYPTAETVKKWKEGGK